MFNSSFLFIGIFVIGIFVIGIFVNPLFSFGLKALECC
ncbi:putative membrane protein [Helicobacter pylori R036d]|uniref:Putative membrane protein n=2 Tax=Helicobacter pylori TaxID=210 RepID=K2L2E7_HELPX|nr:putative membrane protein [Helicobacter pylori Hp A-9]EJB67639.1 putative membrane protein [Helicobacter pylori Hp H-44]EKE84025.1 putative membrane protein [Helicobacter pylori R036d]